MIYSFLADLAVLFHALFVLFVIFGGLVVLRRPGLVWLHLPAAIWGAVVELAGWVCPLTYLENHFRRLGGEAGYSGDFIGHYLEPILYPPGLTAQLQVIMGVGVLVGNAVIYLFVWRKRSRHSG